MMMIPLRFLYSNIQFMPGWFQNQIFIRTGGTALFMFQIFTTWRQHIFKNSFSNRFYFTLDLGTVFNTILLKIWPNLWIGPNKTYIPEQRFYLSNSGAFKVVRSCLLLPQRITFWGRSKFASNSFILTQGDILLPSYTDFSFMTWKCISTLTI